MSIHGHIAHQTNGRVRIDLPAKRGDSDYFSRLSEQLNNVDEVLHVRTNALIGSLVLEFDGPLDAVLQRLEDIALEVANPRHDGLGDGAADEAATSPSPPPASALSALPYRLVSGRQIHPMLLVGLLFGAIGVVQAARGQVLVPALSAFWYAARAFKLANAPVIEHIDDLS